MTAGLELYRNMLVTTMATPESMVSGGTARAMTAPKRQVITWWGEGSG